jgi:hypothetical protein
MLSVAVISSAQIGDRQSYAIPGSAKDFAVADFNRDGKPDFVTTDETGKKVTIFLNNGAGGFTSGGTRAYPISTNTSLSPRRVVTADFNGDGFQDIVTVNCGPSISTLYGNGDGTFQAAKTWTLFGTSCPNSVAVTKSFGDELPDLVITRDSTTTAESPLVHLENQGNGQWFVRGAQPIDDNWNARSVTSADYNGDGVFDFAVVSQIATGEECLYLIFPFTGYPTRRLACANESAGASTVELNNDGIADLVFPFTNSNGNSGAFALTNDGAGRFTSQQLNVMGQWTVSRTASSGDFTLDGIPDIVISMSQSSGARQYVYFRSTGVGFWGLQSPGGPVDGDPVATASADFNADGKMDFAKLGAPNLLQLYMKSFSGFPECDPEAGSGVKICSPASGTDVVSPVFISAAASGSGAITKMRAYVDNIQVAASSSEKIRGSVPSATGIHNLVVNAWDLSGRLYQSRASFRVGTDAGPCPMSGVGVRICAPAAGTSVASPLQLTAHARGNAKIVAMKGYVDGARVASSTSDYLYTQIGAIPGLHNLTVNAWDSAGGVYTANENFSVPACSDPTFDKQIHICAPAENNATKVPISTKSRWDGQKITYTRVYIDSKAACNEPSAMVSCYVTVAPGTHNISVVSWISTGELIKTSMEFNVR